MEQKHQPQPPTNHSLTIKKISERSLVSNKFETVYLNAKTGGSSQKKTTNAAGVPFTLTNHPKTVGRWNRRGLIGQLHKVFDIGRINFLETNHRGVNPQMRRQNCGFTKVERLKKLTIHLRLQNWHPTFDISILPLQNLLTSAPKKTAIKKHRNKNGISMLSESWN